MTLAQPVGQTNKNAAPSLPGEVGIWIFILGDMCIFALLFACFMIGRSKNAALFSTSQRQLHSGLGAANTALLVTGSWFVVLAMTEMRDGRMKWVPRLVGSAIACGMGFCVFKYIEYSDLIGRGLVLNTNDFFMYYFVLTGIHLIHLLIGLSVLTVVFIQVLNKPAGGVNKVLMEGGACYWHMVDLLWIILFPLLYFVK